MSRRTRTRAESSENIFDRFGTVLVPFISMGLLRFSGAVAGLQRSFGYGRRNQSRPKKAEPILPLAARDRPDTGRRDEIWPERYPGGRQKGTAAHPGGSACTGMAPNATPARERARQEC